MGVSGLEACVIPLLPLAPAMVVPTLQTSVMAGLFLSPTLALTPLLLVVTIAVLRALQLMGACGLGHHATMPRLHVLATGVQTRRVNALPTLLHTSPILTLLRLTLVLPLLEFRTIILGADHTKGADRIM